MADYWYDLVPADIKAVLSERFRNPQTRGQASYWYDLVPEAAHDVLSTAMRERRDLTSTELDQVRDFAAFAVVEAGFALPPGFIEWLNNNVGIGLDGFDEFWSKVPDENKSLVVELFDTGRVMSGGTEYRIGGLRVKDLALGGIEAIQENVLQANIEKDRKERAAKLAKSAEALAETVDLWEFVAPPLLPETDEVATAKINAIAQTIIGRQLDSHDMARVLGAYRDFERRAHASGTRISKIEQAQQVLGSKQIQAQIATAYAQLAAENPTAEPAELQRQAEEIVKGSPEFKEIEQAATQTFTPFTAEDIQLQVQSLIGDTSPVEEAGVDMRAAFEGLMQAINGQITQGRFVPGG